jgi:hypothetical protein
MSTSYKPALLKALVRIARRGCDDTVPLRTIGAEFVSLFWTQTVTFHLRQSATVSSEPEAVRRIRSAAELNGVSALAELPRAARERLDAEMARVLKINVLAAFHKSKPPGMSPLFEWSKPMDAIRFPARRFVVDNAPALEALANLWWAKYLERVNLLTPLVIEKVERDGAKRGSLAVFLRILRQTDAPTCFYCSRQLETTDRSVHVDHVIPWSFMLTDPLWNLVLACAPCNLDKSDRLPDRSYLDKLIDVSARRSRITLPPKIGSPLLSRDEIDRFFDAALSVEWPSGWKPSRREPGRFA